MDKKALIKYLCALLLFGLNGIVASHIAMSSYEIVFLRTLIGSILLISCCNDGTRPVIFKIERIDIPETEEETEWLAKQNFKNTAEDAYTR